MFSRSHQLPFEFAKFVEWSLNRQQFDQLLRQMRQTLNERAIERPDSVPSRMQLRIHESMRPFKRYSSLSLKKDRYFCFTRRLAPHQVAPNNPF